jgi:hypothetical protein
MADCYRDLPTGQEVEDVHEVGREAAEDFVVVRQVDVKVGELDDQERDEKGTVGENERR